MKIVIASLMALTATGLSLSALTRGEAAMGLRPEAQKTDADKLYALVQQSRADLREMRKLAGLHAHPAGAHIDPEGHHANDSVAQRERERGEKAGHEDGGREGGHEGSGEHGGGEGHEARERGEHGGREGGEGHGERERGEHGGREGGEEGKIRISKATVHDSVYKNGARLILQYNPNTQAFVGSVQNTTKKTLSQVRVEIHLSNGLELGPTKRIDVKPGKTIPVELSALDQKFTHWVTHPEAGVEEGHGPGGEESEAHAAREKGEHGAGGGDGGSGEHGGEKDSNRPGAAYRPVYNQLQLLRGEMRAFKADLAAEGKNK